LRGQFRSGRESAANRFSERADKLRGKAAEAKEKLKDHFSSTGEQARGTFKSNQEKADRSYGEMNKDAKEPLEKFQQESGRMREQLSHSFKDTAGRADKSFHDNSLLFGIAAAFAGLLLGGLFPETKTEHHALGEKSEDVMEKASEKVLSKGRETSRSLEQNVKSSDAAPAPAQHQESVTINNKKELIGEKQKSVTPAPEKTLEENKSGVLKTAEEKIDQNKSRSN
jgi:ElaB/YqjD/DUF883 family membrane-anchored ribosome-binding protein